MFIAEWIPYFRAHNMSWDNENGTYDPLGNHPLDEFAYMNAMVPAMTNMLNATDDDAAFDLAIRMNAIHKKAAAYMLDGDYYPLTECKKDEKVSSRSSATQRRAESLTCI